MKYGIVVRIILSVVFVYTGIVFIAQGFSFLHKRSFYEEKNAIISQIKVSYNGSDPEDTYYEVIVNYVVDGKQYTSKLGEYNSGMHEGDEISILYDPNDPKKIISSSVVSLFLLFIGGFVFIVVGLAISLLRMILFFFSTRRQSK